MYETLDRIRRLISEGSVRISEHGYDEIAADGLLARELVEGVEAADVVEDYPNLVPSAYARESSTVQTLGDARIGDSTWTSGR